MKQIILPLLFAVAAFSCTSKASKDTEEVMAKDSLQATEAAADTNTQKQAPHPEIAFDTSEILFDGWLHLGTGGEEVNARLGNDHQVSDAEYSQVSGLYVQDWTYKDKGIKLAMESENPEAAKKVILISITPPCSFTTNKGIGIGATAADVQKAYRAFIDKEQSDANHIVVGSVYDGMIFYTSGNKVTEIFIGAAAE